MEVDHSSGVLIKLFCKHHADTFLSWKLRDRNVSNNVHWFYCVIYTTTQALVVYQDSP